MIECDPADRTQPPECGSDSSFFLGDYFDWLAGFGPEFQSAGLLLPGVVVMVGYLVLAHFEYVSAAMNRIMAVLAICVMGTVVLVGTFMVTIISDRMPFP